MQENLRLRVPALEWSVLEGRGELSGLTWVDSNIDVEQESFSVREHSHFPVVQQNILPDVSYQESIRQRHGFQGGYNCRTGATLNIVLMKDIFPRS